jgi:hypothetical protein
MIADADMHAAMPGCDMADNGNPNLCLQHCQAGDQSVQTLPHLAVQMFAAVQSFVVLQPAQTGIETGSAVASALPARVTLPPPLARFGFLRI